MAVAKSSIEWCDSTWSPVRGCTRVSEGCRNCYAEHIAARFSGPGLPYEGLARRTEQGPRWTGEVRLIQDALKQPIRWRTPKRIFVNPMSDLFHEKLSDSDIDEVFGVMWACRYLGRGDDVYTGHVFQVLTKRPARMYYYLTQHRGELARRWAYAAVTHGGGNNPDLLFDSIASDRGVHPRIWLGVSCENQDTLNERARVLSQTPAAVRFVSCEPLLGPVDLSHWVFDRERQIRLLMNGPAKLNRDQADDLTMVSLDWVIAGSESGPGARPMEERWVRAIKEQCVRARVPFFYKQALNERGDKISLPLLDGTQWSQFPEVHRA